MNLAHEETFLTQKLDLQLSWNMLALHTI